MIQCMVLLCMIFPLQEGSGFVAVKTGSLVIFGSYSSVMFPSVCVEAVERLGELDRGGGGGGGGGGEGELDSQHGSHPLLLMFVYSTLCRRVLESKGELKVYPLPLSTCQHLVFSLSVFCTIHWTFIVQ